jgi:hypothetical protein
VPWFLVVVLGVAAAVAAGLGVTYGGTEPPIRTRAANTFPSAPPESFGGYSVTAHVTEIGASWRVPRVASSSPSGTASTWVGAANTGGYFIQLGIVEIAAHKPASGTRSIDQVFWSDPVLGYHAKVMGYVSPGDALSVKMTETLGAWTLHAEDTSTGRTMQVETTYAAGVVMNQGQWIQEDPLTGSANRDVAYPTLSDVTFGSLTVDTRPPRLSFDDAQALSTQNDFSWVPTRVHHDSFSIVPADAVEGQYLADVSTFDRAVTVFDADARGPDAPIVATGTGGTGPGTATGIPGTGPESPARQMARLERFPNAVSAFGAAIEQQRTRLSSQTWPAAARAGVGDLVVHDGVLLSDLSAWESAGAGARVRSYEKLVSDTSRDGLFADRIRTAIGLPPAS